LVHAAVTLRDGQSARPEDLIAFCKEYLAKFKVPKAIVILDALPKSAVGKILRRALREPYWEDHKSGVHGAE
jgi:acyl-CoA synthetase (AMP-forming)/AMP-acid ligase II